MNSKVATVNVLELIDSNPTQLASFKDDKKGNAAAEKLFAKMAKENGASDADIESYIEYGAFTYGDEVCGVYLIHSS